jgi:uncharacterized protein DUF2283
MKDRYLEVTFRNGKPFAAYLYLPRGSDERSVRSEEVEHGMVIDFGPNDHPIGIELTAPEQVTIDRLNQVLRRLKMPPMREGELAPLSAA